MNKIKGGRTALITIGIISLILSLLSLIFGIVLLVGSLTSDINIVKLIFGILLIIVFFPLIIIGIYFTWVGFAIKATNGSIVEGNLGKGTANKKLCSKCGTELNNNEEFCPNCGQTTKDIKICKYCNAENNIDNKNCSSCGKEFE